MNGDGSAALALAAWFQRLRTDGGFGGPTTHWWRDNLLDCRPGYDWRYEGIVAGLLALHRRTGDRMYLDRARIAGDDLRAAQDAYGHFARSRFELNPGSGGTPHEAAAAGALLRLAGAANDETPGSGAPYLAAARATIAATIRRLWDEKTRTLRDDPTLPAFVPNKAATFAETLLLDPEPDGTMLDIAHAIAESILAHQVRAPGRMDGAIAQSSVAGRLTRAYFPLYVARCIPPLLEVARATGSARFREAARAAGRFIVRWLGPDGSLPQVIYGETRVHRAPRWVAGYGDILRALNLVADEDFALPLEPGRRWLLAGLQPDGSIATARGFAVRASDGIAPPLPDFRDLLPCPGWADKAFRFAAESLPLGSGPEETIAWTAPCHIAGRTGVYSADPRGIEVTSGGRVLYRWRYGEAWAAIGDPALAAK